MRFFIEQRYHHESHDADWQINIEYPLPCNLIGNIRTCERSEYAG